MDRSHHIPRSSRRSSRSPPPAPTSPVPDQQVDSDSELSSVLFDLSEYQKTSTKKQTHPPPPAQISPTQDQQNDSDSLSGVPSDLSEYGEKSSKIQPHPSPVTAPASHAQTAEHESDQRAGPTKEDIDEMKEYGHTWGDNEIFVRRKYKSSDELKEMSLQGNPRGYYETPSGALAYSPPKFDGGNEAEDAYSPPRPDENRKKEGEEGKSKADEDGSNSLA